MQEVLKENGEAKTEEPIINQTDKGSKNGQDKCPRCGATDISLNPESGKLRCNFCRYEFEYDYLEKTDLNGLEGEVIGAGATNIVSDAEDILTLKCTSCGAEVVIDTAESAQARCHWCRNTLSINEKIPNGAIPDAILPFNVQKDTAKRAIERFVGKRSFFADPTFKKEFIPHNIMGVYFPYMLVDVNAHARFVGEGEHQTRRYTVKRGKSYDTYYDADVYNVQREFDIVIDGLTVEASVDKLTKSALKTNNIINTIMPFDTEHCVHWNANYLRGYTSERRDVNIEQVRNIVTNQSHDVARHSINNTLKYYDRGVAWQREDVDVKGQQWHATYLPVWLYSYQNPKNKVIHYLAVNGRTEEVMGSVPINMPKLLLISGIIEFIGLWFWWTILIDEDFGWLCILVGFVYYWLIYSRYRNSNARHYHEAETKTEVTNMEESDTYIKKRNRQRSSRMNGANNTHVGGAISRSKMSWIGNFVNSNEITKSISDTISENDESNPFKF